MNFPYSSTTDCKTKLASAYFLSLKIIYPNNFCKCLTNLIDSF